MVSLLPVVERRISRYGREMASRMIRESGNRFRKKITRHECLSSVVRIQSERVMLDFELSILPAQCSYVDERGKQEGDQARGFPGIVDSYRQTDAEEDD